MASPQNRLGRCLSFIIIQTAIYNKIHISVLILWKKCIIFVKNQFLFNIKL